MDYDQARLDNMLGTGRRLLKQKVQELKERENKGQLKAATQNGRVRERPTYFGETAQVVSP